jgi:transposase
MSGMSLLTQKQMSRISPFFPLAHGVPRIADRRVIIGIVYLIRYVLQWKDAPKKKRQGMIVVLTPSSRQFV